LETRPSTTTRPWEDYIFWAATSRPLPEFNYSETSTEAGGQSRPGCTSGKAEKDMSKWLGRNYPSSRVVICEEEEAE